MKTQYSKFLIITALGWLMASPSWLSAQSILLTAEDFVLLGGTAVTVAGPGPNVYSNGNVGAAASIDGFPPAIVVNGTTILGGVIVGQALDDLITARNALNALESPPANNLSGQDLATQILAPGVYTFDVAAELSLNGVLTLDAQGQNNVTWVINIGTSLTTGANAKIEFINLGTNGGADNGLFWNAGSAITFGATNVIAGNYLAGTDITFGTTIPGEGSAGGRALALAGVSFDGSGEMDALGGPGNGDLTGGLTFENGDLVKSGYVLLSSEGNYTQGDSSVVLVPGRVYNTLGVTVDGDSSDTNPLNPSTLTVFQTIATLTGTNTYTGGTIVDAGVLTTGSQNLPTDGNVSLIDSNNIGTMGSIIFDQADDGTFGGVISGEGSLTKENTAALTLTGANTYTGGTIVDEGTLIASTLSLPADGGVALATDTTLVLDDAIDGIFAGNISGDGTFEKHGIGTLSLTGTNTYEGGTIVDGGALSAGSQNLPTDGNISLIDSNNTGTMGSIIFDQADDGTFGGVISGEGSLTKENTAALTLTGVNTYTGGTIVDEGTLIASTTVLPTSGDIALATDATLVLDETTDSIYNGNISGNGTLQKQGDGALTLANSTTSIIDLQVGSLFITGGAGATTVAENAFLGGIGTINGNLINNGTVSPGFSPGTIFVLGNYTQGANGTLIMEFASDTSFDQLIVSGEATLAGTLQIDLLGGYTPVGQSFEIITAVDGVDGTFDTVTGTAAAIATAVNYDPNSVTVEFLQIPFVVFAGTPNQMAVADAASNSAALTDALNNVPLPGQMPAALNAISPQGYQIWSSIALDNATSLSDRLFRSKRDLPDRANFYFEGGQVWGTAQSDGDVGKTSYRTNYGLVGGNYAVGPNLTVGGFFEYSKTGSGLGSPGSNTDIESKILGARVAWEMDQWFATAIVGYSFDDYDSVRPIQFPGTFEIASSSTSGHQWIASINAGRNFDVGPVTLTPFAGLLMNRWDVDGFTETGAGAFNTTVASQSITAWRSQLGMEVSAAFEIQGVRFYPNVSAAWLYDISNNQRTIGATIDSTNFNVTSSSTPRNRMMVGTGLGVALGANTTLYANVSTQIADGRVLTSEWFAGLSYRF